MGLPSLTEKQDKPAGLGVPCASVEPSNQDCKTCALLLGLFKGPCDEEITLENVPQLIQGSVCKVHAEFFRWAQTLSSRMFAVVEDDSQSPGEDSHVRIIKSLPGIIRLESTRGCHIGGEFLIASLGSDGRDPGGGARIVNRKWIDTDMIKGWKTACTSEHGTRCSPASNGLSSYGSFLRPPLPLLLDTVEGCLVDGTDKAAYVCLSYVWGKPTAGKEPTRTTLETLHKFRQPGALHLSDGTLLARTIRDAMSVTRLLGERYLWVDSLCIVQDDDTVRHSLINNMHAIYANATLTIIAADGVDADAGLKGIRELSSPLPRDNPCIFVWPDGTTLNWPGSSGLASSLWNERGWTFQEYLFSQKRLIFVADSVRWECRSGCFWEEHTNEGILPTAESHSQYEPDNAPIRRTAGSTSMVFPDMVAFNTLVNGFNNRQFTYTNDVMDGFAGVLSALAPAFPGGFIWGVPVMYLDLALTWRAQLYTSDAHRRWDPRKALQGHRQAPTWSWASWRGHIETALAWRNEDWLLFSRDEWFYNVDPIRRIIPLLRWSLWESKKPDDAMVDGLPDQNAWHSIKTRYTTRKPPPAPPSGWTRWPISFDSDNGKFSLLQGIDLTLTGSGRADNLDLTADKFAPQYYYTHKQTGSSKFCYPLPIREEENGAERSGSLQVANVTSGRYLCASTHHAFFNIAAQYDEDYQSTYDILPLEQTEGKGRVGRLWPDERLEDDSDAFVLPLELVVISAKYRARGGERWVQAFGGESPQLYNVLWIEWLEGVAYRRGIGEVEKEIWDAQTPEPVALILG
ncbi:HET-domain-containing protein [Thozetella sp. PMI_491]|nr:HET-domain-containing protein [Thozetella sp. PMI_491]